MNRFTAQIKKHPGKNICLPVIVLYGAAIHKMKNYPCKYMFDTRHGPLGDYHMAIIKDTLPMSDIVYCVGHDMNKVKSEHEIKRIENHNWESTSDIESVRLALNIFPGIERCLIISGDTYFAAQDLNFKFGESCCLTYQDHYDEEIGLNIQDGQVVTTAFEFKEKFSGIMYLDGAEFKAIKNYASPRNSKCELWEFFSQIERYRMRVYTRPAIEGFIKITESEELGLLL